MSKKLIKKVKKSFKGHFENDLKEGVWKFHNADGKVVEKRTYKAGELEQ